MMSNQNNGVAAELTDEQIDAMAKEFMTAPRIPDPRSIFVRFARAVLAKAAPVAAVPAGWRMVPIEPTPLMIAAMACSKAADDEGEFPAMSDLLDFSGENKTVTVLKAAYAEAMRAAPVAPAAPVAAASQWISVDEWLPDDGATVLVAYWPYDNHENTQAVMSVEYHDGTFYTDGDDEAHPPSHWMPLPPIPAAPTVAVDGS